MELRLIERILTKYSEFLLLLFLVSAGVPMFMFETEFNEPFIISIKYLTAPLIIIIFFVSYFLMPNWQREAGRAKAFALTFMASILFPLFSMGHVIGVNAWLGHQSKVNISGFIVDREKSSGSKTTSYYLTITNDDLEKKLSVSSETYAKYIGSDFYSEDWRRGSLGLIYK